MSCKLQYIIERTQPPEAFFFNLKYIYLIFNESYATCTPEKARVKAEREIQT
jgi:hypothetical protein